jgi:hypothetical protein
MMFLSGEKHHLEHMMFQENDLVFERQKFATANGCYCQQTFVDFDKFQSVNGTDRSPKRFLAVLLTVEIDSQISQTFWHN